MKHLWLGGLRHRTRRGATREGQICQRCRAARVAVLHAGRWRTVRVLDAEGYPAGTLVGDCPGREA